MHNRCFKAGFCCYDVTWSTFGFVSPTAYFDSLYTAYYKVIIPPPPCMSCNKQQ